jgi:hypothetical protein
LLDLCYCDGTAAAAAKPLLHRCCGASLLPLFLAVFVAAVTVACGFCLPVVDGGSASAASAGSG